MRIVLRIIKTIQKDCMKPTKNFIDDIHLLILKLITIIFKMKNKIWNIYNKAIIDIVKIIIFNIQSL